MDSSLMFGKRRRIAPVLSVLLHARQRPLPWPGASDAGVTE